MGLLGHLSHVDGILVLFGLEGLLLIVKHAILIFLRHFEAIL